MSSFSKRLVQLAMLLAALVLSSGCVSSRAFIPTEHVTALSPDGGQFAAEYQLLEGGQSLGDVKVWSAGASRDGSDAPTLVRVGFEISNQSPAPLRFDRGRLFLEELPQRKGATPGRSQPHDVRGDTLVPPGESRQLDVTFALPSSVWPSDVPGYRVGWTVVGKTAHSRKTPFSYRQGPRYPDPWYPYYSPYYGYPRFYGSWSVGFGYRWPPPWPRPRYYYWPYRR